MAFLKLLKGSGGKGTGLNKDMRDGKFSVCLGVQNEQLWLPGMEGLCKDVVSEAGVEAWGLRLEGFEEQSVTLS